MDAVTGATVTSHRTHEVNWDLKNYQKNSVMKDRYRLRIELTDQHSQGPLYTYEFLIKDSSEVIQLPDQTNFHDMTIEMVTITGIDESMYNGPDNFILFQNYPNPFNPVTTIKYQVVKSEDANMSVYNFTGEKIVGLVNERQNPGDYQVQFNTGSIGGGKLPSGVSLYKLSSGNFTSVKKLMLLK